MKNILYIENSFGNSYGYYQEIIKGLIASGNENIQLAIFKNFKSETKEVLTYNIQEVINTLRKKGFNPDVVFFGFGWTNSGYNSPNNFLIDESIPKFVILNKEYAALDKKLEWIKKNNFLSAFTVHHDFEKYSSVTKIPFYHLPFAANPTLFKNYKKDNKYEFDFGFTGIVRKEQTENWRYKVHNTLSDKDLWGESTKIYFTDHHHDSLEDYARRICTSKIWFSTTGPADLVGTRYYEVMLTGTTLLACNRFDYLGLFKEDEHCIMFDSVEELADKVKFYSDPKNETLRMKIIENAYNLALNNHTWENRGQIIYDVLKEVCFDG